MLNSQDISKTNDSKWNKYNASLSIYRWKSLKNVANQFQDFFNDLPDEFESIIVSSKKGDKKTDFPIGYYIYSWHRFKFLTFHWRLS